MQINIQNRIVSLFVSIVFFISIFNISGIFAGYELVQRCVIIASYAIILLLSRNHVVSYVKLLLFCSLITLLNIIWLYNSNSDSVFYSSFVYITPCFFIYFIFHKYENLKVIQSHINIIMLFIVVMMILEAFIRIKYPESILTDGQREMSQHFLDKYVNYNVSDFLFYRYKLSSFSFFDSNYVAIFLFYSYVLNDYLNKTKYKQLFNIVLFVLILLTLSRAAIISSFVCFFLNFYSNRRLTIKIIYIMLLSICGVVFLSYIYNYIVHDSSFGTKILIFKHLSAFWQYDTIQQLFGFGFPFGSYVYSYEPGVVFAHSLYPLLLGQVGLLGCLGYLIVMVWLFVTNNNIHVKIIILFSLLVGFSLLSPWNSFLFLVLGVLSNRTIVNQKI